MQKHTYGAVLTGDIVGSSTMSARELDNVRIGVLDALRDFGSGEFKTSDIDTVIGNPEFFRGDSWQALIGNPSYALQAAVFVRARLKGMFDTDSRISIGIGRIESVGEQRVSLSLGEAFELSGRGLDKLDDKRLMTMIISPAALDGRDFINSLIGSVQLIDVLVSRWTNRQAEAVSLAFGVERLTLKQIANRMGIKRQTVQKHLDAAEWNIIWQYMLIYWKFRWF